ncbi:MAG TPA: Gfo/Idh/MocA family oxidoreductase [Vicinamibacterales bacterium]
MGNDQYGQNGMSRREFSARLGAAAAGVAVGASSLESVVRASPIAAKRVIGANDRVIIASIGVRGQGNAVKRGFARLKNVEHKYICDIDANLADERIHDPRLADVPTFKPQFVQDFRRALDDKDVDAVVIATPNHWHALATIWALQAGKHVYVEKPASHTVWEGRRMVEAAAHYDRLVQTGTMNRSRPAVIDAIRFIHEGGLGKVYMARGLCFKPRPAIGRYPDGPMAPGEKYALTVTSTTYEPTYDTQYLSKVDYDLWLGPAPKRPFNRNRFHYNWHWHWDYGNGDTGNQGPHQFDIARWGLQKQEHPVKIRSAGGYFGEESSQETPNEQTTMYEYADGTVMEFATRGGFTNDEAGVRIGNIFYGTRGWLWIEERGKTWQSYLGPNNEKGPGAQLPPEVRAETTGLTTIESPHYQNFIDAIRADNAKKLACDIMEGHLSSALPHLANISYRVGRALVFDGATESFVNDAEADRLLTRESYRKGFDIPKSFT